ncbi:MAG: quinone-dependent dihydroorotate dehydrogenase [Pseudomonadota bacterium]
MKMALEWRPGNDYIVEQLCRLHLLLTPPEAFFLSSFFFWLGRSLLFLLPAERSHDLGLKGLRLLHRIGLIGVFRPVIHNLPCTAFGLQFTNPVGLAAGLDKNADYLDALGALGFGFVEVGTVTPKPQPGNPQPRLFRLLEERAIINRMGFNNKGVDHLVEQLKRRRYKGVVGVNIGKNLTTSVENAAQDYLLCLQKVYTHADYVVVNLSSPNTPGLRSLQFGAQLEQLLATLKAEQQVLAQLHHKQVPLLLKIAPDLTPEEIISIAQSLRKYQLDGVIATNTTLSRAGVESSIHANEAGGLSGAPLTVTATSVMAQLVTALEGAMPVIGVGGIMAGEDAAKKLQRGATLVQLYSGFIFAGPSLIRDAVEACKKLQDPKP